MVNNNAEKIFTIDGADMIIRDWGEPPNLDVRKNANPHVSSKWSLGKI